MLRLVKSGKIPVMKRVPQQAFKKAVFERVKSARITAGLEHDQVAEALGMSEDAVRRWESRSLIPHDMIVPFCDLTGAKPEILLAPPKREKRPSLTAI